MSTFLANFATQLLTKLTRVNAGHFPENDDTLVFHSDGAVSLNLKNKEVQKRITQQLESLSSIKAKAETANLSKNDNNKVQ